MKVTKAALLIGLGVLAGIPQYVPAQDHNADQEERTQHERDLRDAVVRLQHARYDLAIAERRFYGERGDALQQTQFALEQLFAALNDDRWKEQDRQLWEKQSRDIEEEVDRRKELGTTPQGDEFPRAESGLRNLRDARRLVDEVDSSYGGHKSKALVHIDEAIKAMEKGIAKAREAQKQQHK